jgi:hypothetical protein
MKHLLVPLLIVAVSSPAPTDVGGADAPLVYYCGFETAADVNYDGWPDEWTRRRDRDYPQYLNAAIADDSQQPVAGSNRCLRIDLDGGAAAVFTPPIPISPRFSYVLDGLLRTENLRHHVAFYSITFLDSDGKTLETRESPHRRDAAQWENVRLGPIAATHEEARQALIGLHLVPDESGDLKGSAMFDDVRLSRLPRLTLQSNSEHNVFTSRTEPQLTVRVSGTTQREPRVRFELFDVFDHPVADTEQTLAGKTDSATSTFTGAVTWQPPIGDEGFYRLRATLVGDHAALLERRTTLAVIRSETRVKNGEFGWTLPGGERPLALTPLADLLGRVGINWVKLPVWSSDRDTQWSDRIAKFAERLSRQQIELVGMLDQPPADARGQFSGTGHLPVGMVFRDPQQWQPLVDPVMSQLSLKIRWWQLGGDDDTSFGELPDLEQKIMAIKEHLARFGQDIQLGVGWDWRKDTPRSKQPPWDFLSYTTAATPTIDELNSYLSAAGPAPARRWVVVRPLPRGKHTLETRARDLVERMLAAKIHNGDGAFVPDPFDDETGLMSPDGTPAELLLPWRTTALMIGGSQFIGSIELPQGSRNYVFARDGAAVMVVWNDRSVRETIFLGPNVRPIDVWGRETLPVATEDGHAIDVGTLPTFITGVNLPMARWQIELAFDNPNLASIFGREQTVMFRFANSFDQAASGTVVVHAPKVWDVYPKKHELRLAAGQSQESRMQVLLRLDADAGDQPVRLDFDVTADQHYKFSVYRRIHVGLEDVAVELHARLDERGSLVVEQHLTNKTDQFVSFNCYLFAPDRRRQRVQVLHHGRGRRTDTYVYPDGAELAGQTLWLRAEEIGGERLLNYKIVVDLEKTNDERMAKDDEGDNSQQH